MSLIVLIGAQAAGKMTVGKELEKRLDAKLLFNHQTIDLFANFLGYSPAAFALSNQTQIELFKAFVQNEANNTTKSIIFTVLIGFDQAGDLAFLQEIAQLFTDAQQKVYFIELVADIEERLKRNCHEDRLAVKPSKRALDFSRNELLSSFENYRLESLPQELTTLFPTIPSLKINNTHLSPDEVSQTIIAHFSLT
ncbi:hypothetical protein ACOYX7_05975 [Enterococcus casseliflavus]